MAYVFVIEKYRAIQLLFMRRAVTDCWRLGGTAIDLEYLEHVWTVLLSVLFLLYRFYFPFISLNLFCNECMEP